MADLGHKLTDKQLKQLEKEIAEEYKTAVREMEEKLQAYLNKTEAQRQVQEQLWKDGSITKKEYTDWCYRHEMVGKRWEAMRDTLAEDMHHTNEIALGITKGKMPDVYALNANYATYQLEHDGKIDTSFTLYSHDTAEYLLGDQRQLMPKPSAKKAREIAANKDLQWNKEKIQSAVLQGVLQGEAPHQVAERLRSVGQMNYNASVRYARTMTTSAQNAGRYEAYRRAKNLGVDLTIEWMATLDHRTRHDHRLMHGQRTEVDKPFHTPDGFTIYYPADCTGDSNAPQKEIWNCRCTLKAQVKGYESDTIKHSPKMGDMTYEEWLEEKSRAFTKKGNPVKIESFSDKVDSIKEAIKKSGGNITEEYIMQAGGLLADEFDAMLAKNKKDYEKIVAPFEADFRKSEKVFNQYQSDYRSKLGTLTKEEDAAMRKKLSKLGTDVVKKRDAFYTARKPYMLTQDKNADWLANKIGEVREVGTSGIDLTYHLMGRPSPEIKRVEYAYSLYPKEWVEKSVAKNSIKVVHESRGYYERGLHSAKMAISGSGAKANATAIHELGHRFEDSVPDILRNERSFYTRRTFGEPKVPMGKGYDRDEFTRKDKFIDKYIGKEYETGKDYELVSMGFQYAYTEPEKLAKDPEFQKWIYGQLLLL